MTPGQAPRKMSSETIALACLGYGVLLQSSEWLVWAIRTIEPIEDEI